MCPNSKQDIKTVYCPQECYSGLLQDLPNSTRDKHLVLSTQLSHWKVLYAFGAGKNSSEV